MPHPSATLPAVPSNRSADRPEPLALRRLWLTGLLTVATITGGCKPADTPPRPSAHPIQSYAVTGVVHRLQPDGLTAIIDHEMIPGYMMAMTMPFQAKDPQAFAHVYPGDQITFRLLVTTHDAWIDQVRKTGQTRPVPSTLSGDDGLNLIEELDVGDLLPDCTLTNDQGQVFQLSDLRGQALALTFVFTRCPLPTYCPLMSRNFALASQELLSSNSTHNWHLLTISFDPDFDSPRVLDIYARQYRTDPARWTFASGDRDAVEPLGRQLGLLLFREETTISHNLRTVVLDPSGRIQHIFRDNQWKPAELAAALRAAARIPSTAQHPTPTACQLAITGMSCEACALTIQSALRKQPGIVSAEVDFTRQSAHVTYHPTQTSPQMMIQTIKDLTYDASLITP